MRCVTGMGLKSKPLAAADNGGGTLPISGGGRR